MDVEAGTAVVSEQNRSPGWSKRALERRVAAVKAKTATKAPHAVDETTKKPAASERLDDYP
eukprot:SAG31_NODE_5730_length_2356_cov_1.278245_1_plen_60_part_10